MPLALTPLVLPLRVDGDGVMRVANTRVTLDTVIAAFSSGATAEQIVQDYPVLQLPDVYAVIAFYLRHQPEVDTYLAEQRAHAEPLQQQWTAQYNASEIRNRLLARRNVEGLRSLG